jgi:hypothetical protein
MGTWEPFILYAYNIQYLVLVPVLLCECERSRKGYGIGKGLKTLLNRRLQSKKFNPFPMP